MRFADTLKIAAYKALRLFGIGVGGQGGFAGGWSDWPWRGEAQAYDYARSVGELYENPVVMACISWVQRAFPEPELVVERRERSTGEWNQVPDHPAVRLLSRPNPDLTPNELWERVVYDWFGAGDAYLVKFRSSAGKVIQLWPVPPSRLRPQWAGNGTEFISHYLLQSQGDPQRIEKQDVIHFRFGRNPLNERLGWSPILSGLREVAALNEGANYRGALLRNFGVPGYVLSPKDAENPITPDQALQMRAMWDLRVSGSERGKPLIPPLPLDVQRLGYSVAELDLGTMLNWDADMICSLVGLSSMVVGVSSGSEHRTFANYAESREAAFEQCIIPTQAALAAKLTQSLLPELGNPDEERIRWDYSQVRILQEDETKKWGRLDNAVKVGWLTPNEARALVGMPEIEGGEKLGGAAPEPEPNLPESAGDAAAQAEQPAGQNGNGRQAAAAR